jgi:ParB-like chromosome segregation protein Spo0J
MQAMAMNAVSALPISSAAEMSRVALADLKVDCRFRESGVSKEHVELLAELDGRWPPILVRRADRLVVDGMHRVAAARLLGLRWIEADWFDGDPDEALLEFVRRNSNHGLPLTLRERKRVASRLLCTHADWSDRRLAEVCAISPKTVASLRTTAVSCPSERPPQLDSGLRVGRDDRARPVNRAAMRLRVVEAIKAQPGASLRSVAAVAGVSPETVRLVRMSLSSVPDDESLPSAVERVLGPATTESAVWEGDAALVSCDEGDFVAWFDQTSISEHDSVARAQTLPLGRVYEVADEARRRSDLWMRFARRVEARATKRN